MAKITTVEEALAAVRENGWALGDLPKNLKTAEVCLEAVKSCGGVLQYVPNNLKTEEMCLEAVKNHIYAFQDVPEKFKTAEVCLEAVKMNGNNFERVPENLRTAEMCLVAVKGEGGMLKFVPEKFKTAEVCFEAMKTRSSALQFVPENLKTAELCFEAVRIGSQEAIDFVPDKFKTIEFYTVAVKGYTGIEGVSYRSALMGNPLSIVPEELREEMRVRLKNESVWIPYYIKSYAAEINIGALTQEAISFEFNKLSEKKLNSVPPNTPDSKFAVESDFVTDKIKVFVVIPDHREVPKSITLKLTNIGKTAEQRETVINCNGRFTKAELGGIVILRATKGKPRNGYKYRQKAEITLNFENRSEPLICPVSRTTTFSMSFYDAYEAQSGKPGSVGGSICEFPDTVSL